MKRLSDIEVVLFDIGGVLVEFSGVEVMKSLANIEDDDTMWHRWLTCKWVREFERGGCTDVEFAVGIVTDWELAITPTDFLASFRSWDLVPYDGAHELVADARESVRIGCLSNINSVLWEVHRDQWEPFSWFDPAFVSYRIGHVKPDAGIFHHVIEELGVAPSQILFIDDNQINVDGALVCGITARCTKGVASARSVLAEFQILAP